MNGLTRKFLFAKVHGATITHADVAYEGSISLPPSLLAAAGFGISEAVCVWNVTNGSRLETYTIAGDTEGVISINGAAAHLMHPGHKVIIAAFCFISDPGLIVSHQPAIVFVDEKNQIKQIRAEVAGPKVHS